MNKVIIRHSLIKFINYLSTFLIISYLSQRSSLDNLSIYFFLISLLNFGVLIINYGYSHTSQNYLPKLIEKNLKTNLNFFLSQHLIIILINSILFTFIYVLIFNKVNLSIYIFLCLCSLSLNFFFLDTFRAFNKPYIGQYVLFNQITFFNLILIIFFNEFLIVNEINFLIIFIISSITGVFFFILKFSKIYKLNFNFNSFNDLIDYYKTNVFSSLNTISFAVLTYFFTIFLYINQLNIDVVHFNISFMFASLLGLPLVFFNINYARKISILFENNKLQDIKNFTKKITVKATILTVVAVPFVVIFQSYFGKILFNINFNEYQLIFIFLTLGIIVNTIFGPNQIFLIVSNNSKWLFCINTVLLALHILILTIFFEISALNCSIFFLTYYLSMNIALFLLINKKYKISIFLI